MRTMKLLTAAMVAGLFVAPAFAAEDSGGAGSNQIHCSPAKNGNAAADPNCQQRVPPMPMPGSSGQASSQGNPASQRQ
jgi:hypothetical protein